jgi:hypothetical protein
MKKTAVEWLVEQLQYKFSITFAFDTEDLDDFNITIQQANEMFEQQIEDAWKDGFFEKSDSSKIYYHKTFKIE